MKFAKMGKWFAISIALIFALFLAADAFAARSGGRFGGGFGFSRSSGGFGGKSFGSGLSRSYGSRGGGYPSGPSFFPVPFGGFSFFPFFGFSPFFFFPATFIIIIIAALILKALYTDLRNAYQMRGESHGRSAMRHSLTVAKLQLALFATARFVQDELERLALSGRTDTPEGLAQLLREAATTLNRRPDLWKYALWNVEHQDWLEEAEARFNEIVAEERSKYLSESISSIEGKVEKREAAKGQGPGLWEVGQYIMVSIIVALDQRRFDAIQEPTQADIQRVLTKLCGITPRSLLAMQVIWTPESRDDALTEEDLLLNYPGLKSL